MRRARSGSRAARRACAALLGIAAALLSAELVLRALPSESLGFVYARGVFTRPPEFTEDERRNALGFHAAELPPAEDRAPQVLLLGDSYVAALSVPLEETVGQRLERELDADGGRSLRVIAAGLPGWGQAEQLEALRALGPHTRSSLVLTLLLPFNDLRDNHPALEAQANAELEALARYRPGWLRLRREEAPLFFFESSLLNQWLSFHAARRRERTTREATAPLDYEVYVDPPSGAWIEAWERTERLLLETADTARQLGAAYAVALASTPHGVRGPEDGLAILRASYPALRERALDLTAPTRRLERFCREHGIPCLELEARFAAEQARRSDPLHWPRDGHWNVAGNAFAAQQLARFVREVLASASARAR
ncbi:MAG: hypothetical protein JNM84_07180 [Planctomycetes bacterium]|nr:hypothetical protein [Planctomycetota bacterium]